MAVTKPILSPTFLTFTLGCRVNQAEITDIKNKLVKRGWLPHNVLTYRYANTKVKQPDLVLINTCAVTLKAERESRKAVHHFKRIYPKAKIIALGCAAKFVKDADLIIENKSKNKAAEILNNKFSKFFPSGSNHNSSFIIHNSFQSSGRALVKIQEGCNRFCAYCIIPRLRGKPKSKPPEKIIGEINLLVNKGIKEITLCGINLSLYGQDFKRKLTLTDLLKKILKETRAERISLSSIEPEYLYKDHEFIKLFIKENHLAKYFHLALQSGSQETIKAMGRKTDLKKLLKVLQKLKTKVPGFTFRADIIVGFPTESEEKFRQTLEFIEKAPITFCHVFPFSVRQGTLAEKRINEGKEEDQKWKDLPMMVKKERARKVMTLTRQIQENKLKY